MAHVHRFYLSETPSDGVSSITLSREESHHAMRVVRTRVGDDVALFDGQGGEWTGQVAGLSRNEVSIDVASARYESRPNPAVTLIQAWLHRDKLLDEIVRQSTVLGAAEICFFRGDHSEKKPKRSDKWERLAIKACKQCGRLWLPRLTVSDSLSEALAAHGRQHILIAQMDGPHVPIVEAVNGESVAYLVGPEGDFSVSELDQAAAAGAKAISLGDCTYRAEMAAMVGLTLIQHHLGFIGLK